MRGDTVHQIIRDPGLALAGLFLLQAVGFRDNFSQGYDWIDITGLADDQEF